MSGSRSGFLTVLAGIVVAGLVSGPPVAGTGTALSGSAPSVVTAVPIGRASVVLPLAKKKNKPKPTVLFSSTQKLVVDVNPDLPGAKSWKVKLQRKAGSKWKKVGVYRTQGAAETREFPVPAGRYRVMVYARPGYRSVTSKAYRFTPTPPADTPPATPPPTSPPTTPPPTTPPSDLTAPGLVTGLSVAGRTATSISLAWTIPTDPDLAVVIVRRAVGATAPATSADGEAVSLTSATTASVTDAGLAVDALYSYAVFTRDVTGNTSAGVPLATRTLGPSVVSTTRVSVRSDGGQAIGPSGSFDPATSADGRWIAYVSSATNLVDHDTNGVPDVFLHDRDTGSTRRVSVGTDGAQADGDSYSPSISTDGRWITYYSVAVNLVDDDTNQIADVFLYDRDTRTTQRVSLRSDGGQASGGGPAGMSGSYEPAISADGRWITYESDAVNLVDDDTNSYRDVFLHDRSTGATSRVSVRSDGGQAIAGSSWRPAISTDGRWITYYSYAVNLVDNDTNIVIDVFLYDRDTGTTRRVSVRSDGGQANAGSSVPAISADGRWITYASDATNLVGADTNAVDDVFLYDRDTGTTRRVSVRSDGTQATGNSGGPAISGDGRWIAYSSYAADLVDADTNTVNDVFLYDRDTGTTRRVSVRSDGGQADGRSSGPAINGDGRWITYSSQATDLVDADTNGVGDVFLTRMW